MDLEVITYVITAVSTAWASFSTYLVQKKGKEIEALREKREDKVAENEAEVALAERTDQRIDRHFARLEKTIEEQDGLIKEQREMLAEQADALKQQMEVTSALRADLHLARNLALLLLSRLREYDPALADQIAAQFPNQRAAQLPSSS